MREIDATAIIDSYLDEGVWPGDDALNDLQVSCEMYVQHYWREVEDFQPPGDLQDYAADRIGWRGDMYHIPEVIESWHSLTAEDAIEYYIGRVRYHIDEARRLADGKWWEELTYLQGVLVLGHDLLSTQGGTEDQPGIQGIRISKGFWDHWLPQNEHDAPPWEYITRTMLYFGGEVALERVQAACPHLYAQGDFNLKPIWQLPQRVGNRIDAPTMWYYDQQVLADILVEANLRAFANFLVDLPYFDCRWAVNIRQLVSAAEGVYTDRVDFFLWLLRPSAIPTLLAYVWWWWREVVTDGGREPADAELYNEMLRRAEERADLLQDELTIEQLREAVDTAFEGQFMQPEVDEGDWWMLESQVGYGVFPQREFPLDEALVAFGMRQDDARWVVGSTEHLGEDPSFDLQDRADHYGVSIEEQHGWGARLQAPGYLDATEWALFDTEREALEYLLELAPEEDEEDDEEDEPPEVGLGPGGP
jgi:hypothetical protein